MFSGILEAPDGMTSYDICNETITRYFRKTCLISPEINHFYLFLYITRSCTKEWYFEVRSLIDLKTLDEKYFYTIEICRIAKQDCREEKSISWQYSDELVTSERSPHFVSIPGHHLKLNNSQIELCNNSTSPDDDVDKKSLLKFNITFLRK